MAKALEPTPVEVAAGLVGDAWTALILREALLLGTRKFVELVQLTVAVGVDRDPTAR